MRRLRGPMCAMIIQLASCSILLHAQATSKDILLLNGVLLVEVRTDRSDYAAGELVHFTALLKNRGNSAVYIAKSFSESGGGIAGFDISIRQLSGKANEVGCTLAGDRGASKDSRTPKEILEEDFLRLPPGGIVGYENQYHGCTVKYPGTYQITATYCACDLSTRRVMSDGENANQIVTGQIRSKPWTFRVHERSPGKR